MPEPMTLDATSFQVCAHSRVTLKRKVVGDGRFIKTWWSCDDCHIPFVPLTAAQEAQTR